MSKQMKSLRIDEILLKQVQAQAKKEQRSVNSMMCILMERQLKQDQSK